MITLARGLRRQTQLLQKCARKAKKAKIASSFSAATQKCIWENSCKLEKYNAQMPLKPLGENAAIFPDAFLRGKPINSRLSGIEGFYPVYAYRFTPDTFRPYPGISPRGPHPGLITLSGQFAPMRLD